MNRIKALGTVTVMTAAFATPFLTGTGVASASCAVDTGVLIAPEGSSSTTVIKQSDSCLDLNENHAAVADMARGEYKDGSSWVKSNIGNVRLTTGSTYTVLVSNVLSGVKMRAIDLNDKLIEADYHF